MWVNVCVCVCSLRVQECMPGMLLLSHVLRFLFQVIRSSFSLCRLVVWLLRQPLLSDWFACFLKVSSQWLFGWNTTAALCCCCYSNRVCSNGTAGCHDYTELPLPPFLPTHCAPLTPQLLTTPLFCFYLTPPTNILCLVQAPPHRHDHSHVSGAGSLPPSTSDKTPPGDIPSHSYWLT